MAASTRHEWLSRWRKILVDIDSRYFVSNLETLAQHYGVPSAGAIQKEVSYIHPHYRQFIEASPFVLLATSGKDGLDVSPRGDPAGFVQVRDETTLLLPDRRGNNRIDSLRNILENPAVALIFLIPGIGETLRVNGHAAISTDPTLLATFAIDDKTPRSVLVIRVQTVLFQCSRAIVRSELWNPAMHLERARLPSPGTILQDLSNAQIDGQSYDKELPSRLKTTLY